MTRRTQNRILFYVVTGLVALIALALVAKLSGIPILLSFYDFIRDTSLLIVTVIAAYMAHVFQKRANFLKSLREQWREIVQTKSALLFYLHQENPALEDYLIAQRQLSETIDTMRIVYANVGETDELIGLYPYAPLHHMRKMMEAVDPRKGQASAADKYRARGEIWDAFNAIREHFLDEFDIEEPSKPILVYTMKRRKKDGAAPAAKRRHDAQADTCRPKM